MTLTLKCEKRAETGTKKLAKLREQKLVPAVVYGPKENTTTITIVANEFEKVLREAGESTVVNLSGLDEDKEVLIHEVVTDPVKDHFVHVDFYAIEKGKKVTVNVPLTFVGEAPVEKKGGAITKVLHELEIEAMPKDLPHEIEVDITGVTDFDSTITVADVAAPSGVEILNDPEESIVVASEAAEEPEEPAEEIDMDAIEVEAKGKEESAESDSEAGSE